MEEEYEQHNFIKTLLTETDFLDDIANQLDLIGCLSSDAKLYLNSNGRLNNTLLKKIEKSIRSNIECVRKKLKKCNHIIKIISIIETDEVRVRVSLKEAIDQLGEEKIGGDPCANIVEIPNSTTKNIYLISSHGNQYALHVHTVLGKLHLPEYSPKKSVAVCLSGEELFSFFLGEAGVVRSHLKSPKSGKNDCVNNKPPHLKAFLMQPYFKGSNCLELINNNVTRHKGVEIYARSLAEAQSKTFGISKSYTDRSILNTELSILLDKHSENIFLADSESYINWLINESWVSRKLSWISTQGREFKCGMTILRAGEIENIFKNLCKRSRSRFEDGACLSQLDMLPQNFIYCESFGSSAKICDFEYVSFSDPAYDLGLAIYSLLVQSIRNSYHHEASAIICSFILIYNEHIADYVTGESPYNIQDIDYIDDSLLLAGIALLGVILSDYKNSYEKELFAGLSHAVELISFGRDAPFLKIDERDVEEYAYD